MDKRRIFLPAKIPRPFPQKGRELECDHAGELNVFPRTRHGPLGTNRQPTDRPSTACWFAVKQARRDRLLRSIPLLCEKTAKPKKSFAAKVRKWQQYGRSGLDFANATPYPHPTDSAGVQGFPFRSSITADAPAPLLIRHQGEEFQPSFLGTFHRFFQSCTRSAQPAGFPSAGYVPSSVL